jgi:ABC-type multidrug transport system fused ATPase/permease subunit
MHTIENNITDFFTDLFKTILFFLEETQQSVCVSILHYLIFIVGFYYFFFYSTPGDISRILFLIFMILATLSYYCFNKCLAIVVENNLSKHKNAIQAFMDKCFGEDCEGNVYSKGFLLSGTILLSIIIAHDYNMI